MNISLKQAADILGQTEDEVMFLYQTNKIQARVNQDSLAWEFAIEDVLTLKTSLEAEPE